MATNATTSERTTCRERVNRGSWHSHRCGKPIPEGEAKCKFHLSVDRRAAEREAKRRAEQDASNERQAAAIVACRKLDELGIAARPYYDTIRGAYSGGVTVYDPGPLLDLLAKAGAEAAAR